MADTGYNWAGTTELDTLIAVDTADDTSATGISLDGKAACHVGLTSTAGPSAVDGVGTFFILGSVDGTDYENMTSGSAYSFTITPVASSTIYKTFPVSPSVYPIFKVGLSNECGTTLTVVVDYDTATIPAAS